jgi:hypothetical protein
MWTAHHYSVDHGQRKPSFNITLMQWPLKWPCFLLVDVVVPFRGVPPSETPGCLLFLLFILYCFLYVSCFLVMYVLKSVWVSSLQLDQFFMLALDYCPQPPMSLGPQDLDIWYKYRILDVSKTYTWKQDTYTEIVWTYTCRYPYSHPITSCVSYIIL